MKSGDKGGVLFFESWVEIAFFALLALGYALGKFLLDTAVLYLIIAAAGLITGRLAFIRRGNDPSPFYAIGAALLLGLLLGHRVGAGVAMILIFAATTFLSYKAHKALDFLT